MKKSTWIAAVLALSLPVAVLAAATLDETIAAAEKEIAAAKKMNGTWLNTEKQLDEAKKLKAEGKNDDAMKLAKRALKEAELAQKQAKNQPNPKPHYQN
ncbi:MAG: hypothetical protein OEV31_07390 [Gammaproteobacteria bacterium]|nr:hypothetical protein [Gammaproteobacteria bacterium]